MFEMIKEINYNFSVLRAYFDKREEGPSSRVITIREFEVMITFI